uniref:CCHC-type domain-containing protein n=1 Tax=Arion vulgaris TaxID=1028688 RepID=A0A0B6ZPI0_9EUPU
MKVVNQSTGRDLDPNNIQSSQDDRKRRQWNSRGSRRIELGAELNTTCRRCGGHGHMAMDCYSARGDNQYDMIPEMSESAADDDRSSRRHRKKEHKRKRETRKRQSSSDSDNSNDSGSEDDHKKKSARDAGASYSGGKIDKYKHNSDSDDSDPRKKPARAASGSYSGSKIDKYKRQVRVTTAIKERNL